MSGLEKLTALGRLSARLGQLILKRELVGIDEFNNRYFKCALLMVHPCKASVTVQYSRSGCAGGMSSTRTMRAR